MDNKFPLPPMPFDSHWQDSLSKGFTWMVKSNLQGKLRSQEFNPLLYEQYGWLLLQMQDTIEAGKYLFLSGQNREEYRKAISLYLQFHGGSWHKLVASFPRSAKRADWQQFPESVKSELKRLGAPPQYHKHQHKKRLSTPDVATRRSKDVNAAVLCSCVALLLGYALGCRHGR